MEFKLKEVEANPFRKIKHYPIQKAKVEALKESINNTTFWDNIVARKVGDKAQIAYGHHRLAALMELFPPSHAVRLIIRQLNDEDMIRIMARENMEEWGTSAVVEQETIRTIVEAYADDIVQLDRPSNRASQVRYAPSFVVGDDRGAARDHPYSAESIASYIGWPMDKVKNTLNALSLIQSSNIDSRVFDGLGSEQARSLVESVRGIEKAAEQKASDAESYAESEEKAGRIGYAKSARERAQRHRNEAKIKMRASAKEVGDKLRDGEGYKNVHKLIPSSLRPQKSAPELGRSIRTFADSLRTIFKSDRWKEISPNLKYAPDDALQDLTDALLQLSARCQKEADRTRPAKEKSITNKTQKLLTYD